jgi:hypothetical protein
MDKLSCPGPGSKRSTAMERFVLSSCREKNTILSFQQGIENFSSLEFSMHVDRW